MHVDVGRRGRMLVVDRRGRGLVVLGVRHVEVLRRGSIGGISCSGGWSSVERRVVVGMEDGEGVGVGIGEVGRVEGLVDEIVGVGVNDGVGRWKKGLDGPEVKECSFALHQPFSHFCIEIWKKSVI